MECCVYWIVLMALATVPAKVTGVTITITDTTLVEGENLQVTCRQDSIAAGKQFYQIQLENFKSTTGQFEPVVTYNRETESYVPGWSPSYTSWEGRANLTQQLTTQGGYFTVSMGPVTCDDQSFLRCTVTTNIIPAIDPSLSRNVTISGITQLIELQGAQDCTTFEDADCAYCKNFLNPDDPTAVQPKYARMQTAAQLTCSGQFALPFTQHSVRWYKRYLDDPGYDTDIPATNYSQLAQDQSGSGSSCSVTGRSVLNYYPSAEDKELRIFCEINTQGQGTVTQEISICVQGLIYRPVTVAPGSGSSPSSAGLGGGAIAGIIIGVIAVIVLVVLLVYFLWYRRRDGGESYNTREADHRSAPPVAKKPEMHENTMYDSSGDPHDNHHYGPSSKYNSGPGKVNQAMDDDYYHHDNDTTPRSRDPIGSSV